eukprot:gene25912-33868_t
MFGADFDSIIHHWSTQGLNYYVLAKLLWNPAADVPALVEDYCRAGFGAAAPEVKNYFAQLEALTSELAAGIAGDIAGELRAEEDEPARGLDPDSIYAVIPKYYGPARLAPLRATLVRAAAAAKSSAAESEAEVLRRIAFLGRGLDYAEQQAKVFALVNSPKPDRTALAAALREAGFAVLPSESTYFLCVDLAASGIGLDDRSFCLRAVAEAGVAAIPVSAFYAEDAPRNVVRLCFAKADAVIDEGARRLAVFRQALVRTVVIPSKNGRWTMTNSSNNQGTPETKGSTQGATANDRLEPAVQPPVDPSTNQQSSTEADADSKGGKPKNA